MSQVTIDRRARRRARVSKNLKGDATRPRIRIFRSNRYIYAQAIDDTNGKVMASFSSLVLKKANKEQKAKRVDEAKIIGEKLGQELLKKGVKKALFDRSVYAYHGRVKNLAEGLRSCGLVL